MDDVLNTIETKIAKNRKIVKYINKKEEDKKCLKRVFPKRKPSSLLLTDASAALHTMKTKFRRKNNHDDILQYAKTNRTRDLS